MLYGLLGLLQKLPEHFRREDVIAVAHRIFIFLCFLGIGRIYDQAVGIQRHSVGQRAAPFLDCLAKRLPFRFAEARFRENLSPYIHVRQMRKVIRVVHSANQRGRYPTRLLREPQVVRAIGNHLFPQHIVFKCCPIVCLKGAPVAQQLHLIQPADICQPQIVILFGIHQRIHRIFRNLILP